MESCRPLVRLFADEDSVWTEGAPIPAVDVHDPRSTCPRHAEKLFFRSCADRAMHAPAALSVTMDLAIVVRPPSAARTSFTVDRRPTRPPACMIPCSPPRAMHRVSALDWHAVRDLSCSNARNGRTDTCIPRRSRTTAAPTCRIKEHARLGHVGLALGADLPARFQFSRRSRCTGCRWSRQPRRQYSSAPYLRCTLRTTYTALHAPRTKHHAPRTPRTPRSALRPSRSATRAPHDITQCTQTIPIYTLPTI